MKNNYVDKLHLNHYHLYLLNILLVPLVHNKGASDLRLGNAACDHTWPRPVARPIKRQKLRKSSFNMTRGGGMKILRGGSENFYTPEGGGLKKLLR